MMNTDTIAAIATPPGQGGIGIIRISGPNALAISLQLFRPRHAGFRADLPTKPTPHRFEPFRLNYGFVADPACVQIIDEALMVQMPGPHSYTREDIAEFQLHGGPLVLERVLNLILSHGARIAEPGEFTRRAFLNGRLDLTQAEAVADLIQARSALAVETAATQLSGLLKEKIQQLIDRITLLQAEIEARIEFPEDTGPSLDHHLIQRQLSNHIVPDLKMLADSYQYGHLLREGLRLAIIGRPNVGKSSLLNALTLQSRAIVTPVPGTTRDAIEAPFYIKGVPVVAIDTAGLRLSDDPVERIGIARAQETLETADLVLFVVEACSPFGPADQAIFEQTRNKLTIMAINKIDLVEDFNLASFLPGVDSSLIVCVSALTGQGMAELKETIAKQCTSENTGPNQGIVVTNQRHKTCIDLALTASLQTIESIRAGAFEDMISMDLQQIIDALHHLTGQRIDGDILDTVFQRFCIGK